MKAIYEPKGRAKEYGDLAVNLYRGCGHKCIDCYAPRVLHMDRDNFYENASRRPGVLEAIEKEASAYEGEEVFLCFTTDPYQPVDDKFQYTRKAIKILKANYVNVRILTKGGKRSMRDFDLLVPGQDWYGATLTFTSDEKSFEFEPEASLPKERLYALEMAHALGINTWASMEPVRDPEQTLKLIEMTKDFVDVYKIGKWNYDARANAIDWGRFVHRAIALLEKYGKEYYIKESLKEYL